MSAVSNNGHSGSSGRILANVCFTERQAAIERRKRRVMRSLLSEFEKDIQPLIGAEDVDVEDALDAIDKFKIACRTRLNALTFEAINQLKGGAVNELAGDLAESIEPDPRGGLN